METEFTFSKLPDLRTLSKMVYSDPKTGCRFKKKVGHRLLSTLFLTFPMFMAVTPFTMGPFIP